MTDWHGLEINEALAQLDTDHENGLSRTEAAKRLSEYGPNELAEEDLKRPWVILWEQLTGIMVIILIVAAVVSGLLREFLDVAAIVMIIILNAVLGFTQEYRAEKAMAALKKLAVPTVRVRRGGHVDEISALELVPGDVILLEAGNSVPADARLVESNNLRVQESILTGESEPVEKSTDTVEGEHLPLGDRRNMVYMGTTVTYGRAVAVITGTGMDTELGNIAGMIQSVDTGPTPLQQRLEQLGKGLAVGAVGIVILVFFLGLLRGEDPELMFLTAIGMAVAAVPEGLPAVVTVTLALGAQRMLKQNALIRKLPAVETLGSVTVICSDKTGTLTENLMTVTVLDVAGNQVDLTETLRRTGVILNPEEGPAPLVAEQSALALLLAGGALCNDAILEPLDDEKGRYRAIGDPTEGALQNGILFS
jgi:Ca2+-transporting ATPase